MKKEYVKIEIEIVKFDVENIETTIVSNVDPNNGDLPVNNIWG